MLMSDISINLRKPLVTACTAKQRTHTPSHNNQKYLQKGDFQTFQNEILLYNGT